eukprot:6019133-Alexandrium_andersonii.AAC.1
MDLPARYDASRRGGRLSGSVPASSAPAARPTGPSSQGTDPFRPSRTTTGIADPPLAPLDKTVRGLGYSLFHARPSPPRSLGSNQALPLPRE